MENGVCIIKSTVSDENGNILGVGHAYEKEGSSYINKTSFIENCETSAVGRALGMCGIGVDTSIASADEVANAIVQQSENGNSQKNRNTKGKPQSDPPQDAQSAAKEKPTDYLALNAKYCERIGKAKNITAAEVYEKAKAEANSEDNAEICKILCDWMRRIKQ